MKSPLGRCVVPLDTEKKWIDLMKACEEHEYPFEWSHCGKPTKTNIWYIHNIKTCVSFEYKDIDKAILGYSELEYYQEEKSNFITFEEAMKKLGAKIEETEDENLFRRLKEKQGNTDFEIMGLSGHDRIERLKREALEKLIN